MRSSDRGFSKLDALDIPGYMGISGVCAKNRFVIFVGVHVVLEPRFPRCDLQTKIKTSTNAASVSLDVHVFTVFTRACDHLSDQLRIKRWVVASLAQHISA